MNKKQILEVIKQIPIGATTQLNVRWIGKRLYRLEIAPVQEWNGKHRNNVATEISDRLNCYVYFRKTRYTGEIYEFFDLDFE